MQLADQFQTQTTGFDGDSSGITPIRLNVLDEEHEWADVEHDETDSLKTDDAGSAFILWKERFNN